MQPTPQNTPPTPPTPPVAPQPLPGPATPGGPKSNKRLIIGLIIGACVVFLIGTGVVFAMILSTVSTLNDKATTTAEQSQAARNKSVTANKAAASTCLALSDYAAVYPAIAKNLDELYQDNEIETIFFLADSTDYEYANVVDDNFTNVADFMKQNASKQFTIHLKGSVNGQNGQAGGGVLSTQRAEKVRDALIAKGADASKIVVDPPAVYDQGENPSEFYQSVFRNVGVIVHDNCIKDQQ